MPPTPSPTPTPFPTPTPAATSTALPTPTEVCHHDCPDKLVLAGGIGLASTVSVASVGKLDHLTVRSAFPVGAVADVFDGVEITLSNANGVIYSAELFPGDLIRRGSSLVFLDRYAKSGNGIRGGIAKVKIQPVPKIGGVRIVSDAFGHMGGATQDTMTLTIVVGNDANGITDSWELKSYGWTRIHR